LVRDVIVAAIVYYPIVFGLPLAGALVFCVVAVGVVVIDLALPAKRRSKTPQISRGLAREASGPAEPAGAEQRENEAYGFQEGPLPGRCQRRDGLQ